MKIVATVPVYNRQDFIGAYLDMLLDFDVTPVVVLSDKPWDIGGNEEDIEADKTAEILNTYFPTVKVINGTFLSHGESMNAGIDYLGDFDICMVADCDMYITKNDWKEFLKFIQSEDVMVYKANFETMFIEYYYDWRYGLSAIPGGAPPIVAIKKGVRMKNITHATSDSAATWDIDGPKLHHMRWCKDSGSGKHKCKEPDNADGYVVAPLEIKNRLIKWKTKCKMIHA